MSARPSQHVTWMNAARNFAQRATCPRLSVGAVIIKYGLQISQGYNGAPRKARHCTDVGCDLQTVNGKASCQRAIHAEHNAVLNAARAGSSTIDATMYVTHAPCVKCADVIVQSGITHVIYAESYAQVLGLDKLRMLGVRVSQLGVEV